MRVLVDMDGVIADFEAGFIREWCRQYPGRAYVPFEQRTNYRITEQYPAEHHPAVRGIFTAPGFFLGLDPVPGGLEALAEMTRMGIEVFLCSSPLSDYRNCVQEKYVWVDQHLGYAWTKKIILTKDKTVIQANFLIDDKPEVHGVGMPTWEHILYDAPYNRALNGKRRITWANWKTILDGTA